jgi:hypothetical protein
MLTDAELKLQLPRAHLVHGGGDRALSPCLPEGEPTSTPDWRKGMTDRLEMPADGTWPDGERLAHH